MAVARCRRLFWISVSVFSTTLRNSSLSMNSLSLCDASRRETATERFSMSRGPISTRSGAPFLIQSQVFCPPPMSRLSTSTRIGLPMKLWWASASASASAAAITASAVSGFGVMGRMTICAAATAGGTTAPSSSACAMTSVPMRRVLTPQLVVQPNSFLPSRPTNSMPEALEKFCPRKCEVPAWIALRSCTIASMHRVMSAPGKRSRSVFSPVTTGTAR